jgi:hypothetical protein
VSVVRDSRVVSEGPDTSSKSALHLKITLSKHFK